MAEIIENIMQEIWVQSLGQEDPLEKEMATHSSTLAWRIPWTEEPGGLQSMRLQESNMTERLTYIFKFSHNLFLMWWCEIVILCNENLL